MSDAGQSKMGLWAVVGVGVGGMVALGASVWQTARTGPDKLWVLAAMLAPAVLIEGAYRLAHREIHLHE